MRISCIALFNKYLHKLVHTFLSLTKYNSSLSHYLLHILFLSLDYSHSLTFLLVYIYVLLT